MTEHPITPPPELVQQWICEHYGAVCIAPGMMEATSHVATQAARWGADQELEACRQISYDRGQPDTAAAFQRIRRPKPPSLKEQALHDLEALEKDLKRNGMGFGAATIRRALEALPND